MSVCLPAHKRLSFTSLTRPAGQNCLDCVLKTVRQACWDLSIWCNLYQADACFQHRPPGWRSFLEHVQKTSQNISYLHYLFSVKSTVFSLLAPWRGELDRPEEVSFYLSWYIDHFSTHLSPVALQDNFSLLTTAVAWEWGAGRLAVLRAGDKDSGGCDSRLGALQPNWLLKTEIWVQFVPVSFSHLIQPRKSRQILHWTRISNHWQR